MKKVVRGVFVSTKKIYIKVFKTYHYITYTAVIGVNSIYSFHFQFNWVSMT